MLGYETAAARLVDRIVELDPLSPLSYLQRATFALGERRAAETLADIEQSEKLRRWPIGEAQSSILRKYGLDRESVLQLDLALLLNLVPQDARLPDSV